MTNPDVEIDKNDLDGQWLKQASLFDHYSTLWATKLAEKERIHHERKTLRAKLYEKFKEEAELDGKKITEAGLDAKIRSDEKFQKLSLQLINLEEEANKLDGTKWAMIQKKDSLEHLTSASSNNFKENIERATENKNNESIQNDLKQRQRLKIKKGEN